MARRSPPNLRRNTRPVRQPKLEVTVFCEGANTEPDYFRKFAGDHGNRLVVVRAIGAAGVPMTIVKTAIDELRSRSRRKRNSFEENDQVWASFDEDIHPNVSEAINLARQHGVHVAYSNPCFEVWPIVHLIEQPFNRPMHRHEAQRMLSGLMPNYDPNGSKTIDYELIKSRFDHAFRQAENMQRCRNEEGAPLGNPYTGVHILLRTIKEAGKPD